jgi:hypothetical protein
MMHGQTQLNFIHIYTNVSPKNTHVNVNMHCIQTTKIYQDTWNNMSSKATELQAAGL